MENIIRSIRSDLRLSMNGAVAASMRDKGINYRMNFGVDIPRIQQISEKYNSDAELAETLWNDDVRELKILATMLYPKDKFTKELGLSWSEGIVDQELREQICKNLFQELSFADELVDELVILTDENVRATGYWLFARLYIIKSELVEKIDADQLLGNAVNDLNSDSLLVRQSALNALKFFGRSSLENSANILKRIDDFESSEDAMKKEMFDLLKFEFDVFS